MGIFENFLHFRKEAPLSDGQGPDSGEQAPERREQFSDCVNTTDFRQRLAQGKFEEGEAWLEKVKDNRKDYPQYNDSWVKDRERELIQYREMFVAGKLEQFEQRSKEVTQAELREKFGFGDTTGFRQALARGDIDTAQTWLQYILDNIRAFPQYYLNDSWKRDRVRELAETRLKEDQGGLEKISLRSKEDAQADLATKFGFVDTAGFRQQLALGNFARAREWFEYIMDNIKEFPQYYLNESWQKDRQRELETAERKTE